MVHWILTLLVALHPTPPPDVSYEEIATAIDSAAHEIPLPGEDGVVEMAAELAVLAETEGHMQFHAVAKDVFGRSLGLWQVHESNLRRLGVTEADVLDVATGARVAAWLVAESHHQCRRRALSDALAFYASGRGRCDVPEGLEASHRRMGMARWLRVAHPAVWTEPNP